MYELTYIANPDLSEKDLSAFTEKVKGFIVAKDGQIKNEKIGSKKKLAYPIKKRDFGYYVTVNFNLKSEKLKGLNEQIKSENAILRQLIISKPEKEMAPSPIKPAKPRPAETIPRPIESALPKEIPLKREKVKLEELDKKLKEILEE